MYLLSFFSLTTYGQIIFEKGYFIDNKGEKTDCLIKNNDWGENPKKFSFKETAEGNKKSADISTVKEFGIYNFSKYIRFEVAVDNSSSKLDQLSNVKEPIFKIETHFFKALVEGKASLYVLEDNDHTLYFIKKEDNNIEQLVCKTYVLSSDDFIRNNNSYKNQLHLALKSDAIKRNHLKNVGYNKKELVKIFVNYNKEENVTYEDFDAKQKRDLFHLSVLSGVSYSSFLIPTKSSNNTEFESKATAFIGFEAEFIFPFNKSKWSAFLEPVYHNYESETKSGNNRSYLIKYERIELSIGLRHYFVLNNSSKISLNLLYNTSLDFSSAIYIGNSSNQFNKLYDIKSEGSFAFGAEYVYHKYKIGFRYDLERDLLADYATLNTNFNKTSFIIGYTLF